MSPRLLTATARAALAAQETGEVFLQLITISHDLLVPPLYFVNNTVDIVSRGNTHLGWPFQITLPDERADTMPTVQLVIDNIDRRIMEGIRMLPSAPAVALEVILASDPDTLESGPFNFTVRGVEYDALLIQATVAPEDILNEPAIAYTFSPKDFPGLFA
jgi:hypothetical protein